MLEEYDFIMTSNDRQCIVCEYVSRLYLWVTRIHLILFLHIAKCYLNFYNGHTLHIKEKYSDILKFEETIIWKMAIQVNILNKFCLFVCKKIEFILGNCSKTDQREDSYQY